jgi:hypothetical protein
MSRIHSEFIDPDAGDRPMAVDALVREEPDEDEEDEEEDDEESEDDDEEGDDEGNSDGYSE